MNKRNVLWLILLLVGTLPASLLGAGGNHQEEGEKHDEHGEHEEHDGIISLDKERLAGLTLTSVEVRAGGLTETVGLPAEVRFNPNRVAHLTPRVSGIVREVVKTLGDAVVKGDVLAVFESRELGAAKSAYLSALAKRELREKTYQREKGLWERQISSEQDYLTAKQAYEESRIETRVAVHVLHALGLEKETIEALSEDDSAILTRYMMTAPFDGVVTAQHVSPGEYLNGEDEAFVVTDPSKVWVVGRVNERDIRHVAAGQQAAIGLQAFPDRRFEGTLDYVGATLDRHTRTTEVRVTIPNPDRTLREGMSGWITVFHNRSQGSAFVVPRAALQRRKSDHLVFKVLGDGRFQAVSVRLKAESEDMAEVLGELKDGDLLAVGDTFILRSEAEKGEMGSGHSH